MVLGEETRNPRLAFVGRFGMSLEGLPGTIIIAFPLTLKDGWMERRMHKSGWQ